MAFPQVASSAQGSSSANVTTLSCTVHGGTVAAGDLLLLFVSNDGTATASITTPASGWTQLGAQYANNATNANRGTVFYRWADGSEAATVTVTVTASEGVSYTSYRITGADTGTNPEIALSNTAGSSVSPDPPSLAPSWGSADNLWIAGYHWDGNVVHSAYPTNYASNQRVGQWANTGGAGVATATRELTAASEDPGTGTISASDQWASFTVAVKPAPAGGGTTYTQGLSATLSFTGSVAKQDRKVLAGTLSFTGAVAKQANKVLAGALSPAGGLVKRTARALAGSLTPGGSISASKVALISFNATLSFAGSISRSPRKVLSGSLSFSGSLVKRVNKTLAGTLTFTGAIAKRTGKVLAGSLSPAGALVKRTGKALAAVLTSSGSVGTSLIHAGTQYTKSFAASLTFAGSLGRSKIAAVFFDALARVQRITPRYRWYMGGIRRR